MDSSFRHLFLCHTPALIRSLHLTNAFAVSKSCLEYSMIAPPSFLHHRYVWRVGLEPRKKHKNSRLYARKAPCKHRDESFSRGSTLFAGIVATSRFVLRCSRMPFVTPPSLAHTALRSLLWVLRKYFFLSMQHILS